MTEEKNSKSESKEEQPKLNQEQYDRLQKCSEKGAEGIKEWNKWKSEYPFEEIWLQGANLYNANLQGANLNSAKLQGANFWGANLRGVKLTNAKLQGAILRSTNLQKAELLEANLQGAELHCAKLQEADLPSAKLQGANLWSAKLQGANLWSAKLQGANLEIANLQGAGLLEANLQGANLLSAELQEANLWSAELQGADLWYTKLQGADLGCAKLQGAKFMGAIVNGSTSFLCCEIDENTDFRNTGLEDMRIESGTKYLLKYNIRRMNWEDWYKKSKWWQWPISNIFVRMFWWMSDYGKSTGRIFAWFFGLAFVFSLNYWAEPGLVLVKGGADKIRGFVHALYFSVVTMTTLGFGDIAANPDSWFGQVVLMVQVILGYVLLGALVTRLAVLFTSDGPAGSFTPMDKKTKELLAKLKEDKGN